MKRTLLATATVALLTVVPASPSRRRGEGPPRRRPRRRSRPKAEEEAALVGARGALDHSRQVPLPRPHLLGGGTGAHRFLQRRVRRLHGYWYGYQS